MFLGLKVDLGKVEYAEFVIECCSKAALPTIEMSKDILLFARLVGSDSTFQEIS